MAPNVNNHHPERTYRANNQSRRANRSYVDHDVFEGLPIRNWRRDIINIAPPPIREISSQKGKWGVELPWGMPKDAHLLPKHSQDLLRAARSGRLYIRRKNGEEEEVDADATTGDKPEKKEKESKEKGYSVKTWKLVPKNQEGPEIEFLAKRRKGLIGRAVKSADVIGTTITKARVKRTDAAGNIYFEDVVMEEGQPLEGEVVSQTVVADSSSGKLAVDGIVAQPTPPRRRHPPPKRRAKGPGRGRKRKLPQAPTSVSEELGGVKVEAENDVAGAQASGTALESTKRDGSDTLNVENENEDTEMGDDNIIQSDEEGEEGSDDEDLSEGEAHDDHDDGDEDDNGAKRPHMARVATNESVDDTDHRGSSKERQRDASSSPELPLAMITSTPGHEHGNAGSPLRNVVTFASAFEECSPDVMSDGENRTEAEAEGDIDEVDDGDDQEILDGGKENSNMPDVYDTREDEVFPLPHAGDGIPMEQEQEYTEADEMLLDGDMSGVGFGNDQEPYIEPYTEEEEIVPILVHEDQENMLAPDGEALYQEPDLLIQAAMTGVQRRDPPEAAREEEDTFEDLLGSLEDHLNEQDPGPERELVSEYAKEEDEIDHISTPAQPEAPTSTSPASAIPTMPEMKESYVEMNVEVDADANADAK